MIRRSCPSATRRPSATQAATAQSSSSCALRRAIPLFSSGLHRPPPWAVRVWPAQGEIGGWSDEGTPGPIPNPVVKFVSADGTWGASPWESRSPPISPFSSCLAPDPTRAFRGAGADSPEFTRIKNGPRRASYLCLEAGSGDRTRAYGLGSRRATTTPYPQDVGRNYMVSTPRGQMK